MFLTTKKSKVSILPTLVIHQLLSITGANPMTLHQQNLISFIDFVSTLSEVFIPVSIPLVVLLYALVRGQI
jgi:hypothetical protein